MPQQNQNTSQINPELAKQLEQLRDIHLPEPVGWFPPAIGWWILAGLVVLTVVWFWNNWWRERHNRAIINSALTEFDDFYAEYLKQADSAHFAGQVSALIKRVGIYWDKPVATLSGEAWVDYLQESGVEKEEAEFIAFAPYASVSTDKIDNMDLDELESSVKELIKGRFE